MIDVSKINDPMKLYQLVLHEGTPEERIAATQRLVDIYKPRGKKAHDIRMDLLSIGYWTRPDVPDEAKEIALRFEVENATGVGSLVIAGNFPRKSDGTEFDALETLKRKVYDFVEGSTEELVNLLMRHDSRFCEYAVERLIAKPDAYKDPETTLIMAIKVGTKVSTNLLIDCLATYLFYSYKVWERTKPNVVFQDNVRFHVGACIFDKPQLVVPGIAKAIVMLAAAESDMKPTDGVLEMLTTNAKDEYDPYHTAGLVDSFDADIKMKVEKQLAQLKNPLAKDGVALDEKGPKRRAREKPVTPRTQEAKPTGRKLPH